MSVHVPQPLAGLIMVKIGPGGLHVTDDPQEAIVTVLGSCVSACLRDPVAGVGGMNHFMLPQGDRSGTTAGGSWDTPTGRLRYGDVAMAELLDGLLRRGGRLERMEAKLFGAARLGADPGRVGARNAGFAERFLHRLGLVPLSHQLGGNWARRVAYHPASGRAFMSELRDAPAEPANISWRA